MEKAVEQIPRYELLSKDKLYQRVKGTVTKKAFEAWWKEHKNPVHELFSKPPSKKFKFARITGPPWSFQIDTIRMNPYKRQNGGKDRFLLLVEIGSRKAFAYVLKLETVPDVLDAYKTFLREAGHVPFLVKGDDYFSAKDFVAYNAKKGIPVLTNVAADEHVTSGHPLGILDRCVQTLRSMIEKRIHAYDDPKWTQWLGEIIQDYNENPHTTLDNKTPNQVYASLPDMHERWTQDSRYNIEISKAVAEAFKPGDYVRMRLKKPTFEKGATQTMSLEVYRVVSVKGSRITLETYPAGKEVARASKPNELIKVDKPVNMRAPKAPSVAKKHASHTRKLQSEGLPVPPPDKPAPTTIATAVEKGKLVIVDVEGEADDTDTNRLTVTKDGKTGYVFAGIVTKKTAKMVHMKLFKRPGADTALNQKRLLLSGKSYAIDATSHPDALLYMGEAPRIRSDNTTSIPAAVVEAVRKEYVFMS
jgi:hypothetical protein